MITIGEINTLKVLRETETDLYLADEQKNEVMLKKSLLKEMPEINSSIDVFIYTDTSSNILVSPNKPFALLNTFAYLPVVVIDHIGAYLDWGLETNLFVPFEEQTKDMVEGKFYTVFVFLDERTNQVIGSDKLNDFVSNEDLELEVGEEVDLILYAESKLGFSCIVNNRYKGLVYHNDIYKEVFVGDQLNGFIKIIRDDNLLDISFQKVGFRNVLDSTEIVLTYLQKNNGYVNLHDKSTPEEILKRLNMSKGTFKKSIGILYKEEKIIIKTDGIYLVKN